jgi:hypothetical protein
LAAPVSDEGHLENKQKQHKTQMLNVGRPKGRAVEKDAPVTEERHVNPLFEYSMNSACVPYTVRRAILK